MLTRTSAFEPSSYLLLGLLAVSCSSAPHVAAPVMPSERKESSTSPAQAAAAHHAAACNRNETAACFELGVQYEKGHGVERDEKRAATLFSWACHLNHAAACLHLGALYEQGRGVATDAARAGTLYSNACDAGDAPACASLRTLHEHACDGGIAASCLLLADRLVQGLGMSKDEALAATLYSKACDAKDAPSCFKLAVLVEEGRGVSKDAARAGALYKKACDGNYVNGCINFYTDGCDAGDANSCFELGAMFDDGQGVKQDPVRATELYTKACKGGDQRACAPGKVQKHYATILRALAGRHFSECKSDAADDAIRTTTAGVRRVAGATDLPESDRNMVLDAFPSTLAFETAKGSVRFKRAQELLSVPATLVVDVESFVPPRQTKTQNLLSRFNPGSARVRQVRFDQTPQPVCETRATVKNTDLKVFYLEDWEGAAINQLREQIRGSF